MAAALESTERPNRLGEEEASGLRLAAKWVEALQLRASSPHVMDALAMARAGNEVTIAVNEEDLDWVSSHRPFAATVVVTTKLWFAALTSHPGTLAFTLWIDFSRLATNPFDRIDGSAALWLCSLEDLHPGIGEAGAIVPDRRVSLGHARIPIAPEVRKLLIEQGIWDAADNRLHREGTNG